MKNFEYPCAILVFGTLSACSGSADPSSAPVVEVEEENTLGISWEEYRDAAKQAGGDSGYFVAEWDLVFADEQALRDHYDSTYDKKQPKLAVFQQLSNGFEPVFDGMDALAIEYCISDSFSNKSTVVSDMETATNAWRKRANVRFQYRSGEDSSCNSNNSNVDFAVMPTTASPGLAGCAASKMLWNPLGCPVGGTTVVGVLLIQYGIIGQAPYDDITPVGVLKHELGHMLGFRHEHPWAPGGCPQESPTVQSADVTGRRLTEYDQSSVMHYPSDLVSSCNGLSNVDMTLSIRDGEGARAIYGIPAAWYAAIL